jgi:hypothetical protein
MDAMFVTAPLLSETPDAVAVTYSPTLPAFALSFVVVPTIPAVLDGVKVPVLLSVVNAPVLAVVLPMGPGVAKRAVNPAPLTAPLAARVVKLPVLGVVAPTGVLLIEPPVIVGLFPKAGSAPVTPSST